MEVRPHSVIDKSLFIFWNVTGLMFEHGLFVPFFLEGVRASCVGELLVEQRVACHDVLLLTVLDLFDFIGLLLSLFFFALFLELGVLAHELCIFVVRIRVAAGRATAFRSALLIAGRATKLGVCILGKRILYVLERLLPWLKTSSLPHLLKFCNIFFLVEHVGASLFEQRLFLVSQ